MSDVLISISLVIAAFLTSFLVGMLISYIVRVPSITKRVNSSKMNRWITIILLSLLTLIFVFTGSTRIFAGVMYNYVNADIDSTREGVEIPVDSDAAKLIAFWDDSKSEVLYELWLRQMMPPTDYWECRSKNLDVCDFMGFIGIAGDSTWGSFLLYLGLGIVSAIGCGFFIQRTLREEAARSSTE